MERQVQGGFIWDWVDQGIRQRERKDDTGSDGRGATTGGLGACGNTGLSLFSFFFFFFFFFFFSTFSDKNDKMIICQDRLGTNPRGKLTRKETFFVGNAHWAYGGDFGAKNATF
jgi:hypothetical protein